MFAFEKMKPVANIEPIDHNVRLDYDHNKQVWIDIDNVSPVFFGTMYNSGSTFSCHWTGYPSGQDCNVEPLWENDGSNGG